MADIKADDVIFSFKGDDKNLKRAIDRTKQGLRRLEKIQTDIKVQYESGQIGLERYAAKMDKLSGIAGRQVTALKKLGVQVRGFNSTIKKSGKGSAGGGAQHAAIELTRGVADFNAAGGFTDFSRGAIGAANNVERFAEILANVAKKTGGWKAALKATLSSLAGPAGLILAVTLLVQFGPKLFQFFKDMVDGQNSAARSAEELNKKLRETAGLIPKGSEDQEKALEAIKEINEELDKIDRIEAKQKRNQKELQATYVSQREQLMASRSELLKTLGIIDEQNQKAKDEKAAQKAKTAELKRQKELREQEKLFLEDNKKLLEDIQWIEEGRTKAIGEALGSVYGDKLGDAFNLGNAGPLGIVDPKNIEVVDEFASSVEDLNAILRENGRITADLSVENTQKWLDAISTFESAKFTIEDLSHSMVSAFDSAAGQSGNIFENLAGGILSTIGSLLIKEGGAYIALGIARNAAFPGSGTGVITTGGALVAAGAGLKAGGSSIARGSSGSGGASSASSAVGSRAISTADTTSSNVTFHIGNNELIGSLQEGLDKRRTTHGSSILFPTG